MNMNQKLQHILQIMAGTAATLFALVLASGIPKTLNGDGLADSDNAVLYAVLVTALIATPVILLWWASRALISAIRAFRSGASLTAKNPLLELYVMPIAFILIIVAIFLLPLTVK